MSAGNESTRQKQQERKTSLIAHVRPEAKAEPGPAKIPLTSTRPRGQAS